MDREAMVLELFTAVRFSKGREIKKLTKKIASEKSTDLLLTTVSSELEKNTILHVAVKYNSKYLVEALLETTSLSSLLTAQNARGNTPMHTAAASGHSRLVTSLISHGRKVDQERGEARDLPDMLTAINEQGNTPVHEAAGKGHKKVMEILVKTLDPTLLDKALNQANKVGDTPLSLAILAKSSLTVETILKAQSNVSEFRGPHNQTILHMTIMKGDLATMQIILKYQPELSKERDNKGRTPLHYAAAVGTLLLIQRLLKHDASAAYMADDNQMLPLHLVVTHNERVCLLYELHKSSPNTVEFVDKNGQNVLHMAAEKGNVYMVVYLLRFIPEVEDLINSTDEDGNTPLHLSFKNGHSNIVHLLLKDPRINLRAISRDIILSTISQVHQTSSSDSWEDPKKVPPCLLQQLLDDDPRVLGWVLRRRVMNQAESMDDILELPGHSVRNQFGLTTVDQKLKDMAGAVMLVATLVTTVSFALVFQIPGGYNDRGTAVMSLKHPSFRIFVTTDVMAFMSSAFATICLLLSLLADSNRHFVRALTAAMFLTTCALLLLPVALIAGMWRVFGEEGSLLIQTFVLSFTMLPLLWYMGVGTIYGIHRRIGDTRPIIFSRHRFL